MMQDVLSKPVELIDQDLDEVAGGDFNIAEIEQELTQIQVAVRSDQVDQTQAAAQVATISQSN
jgi:hypothetical protein